MSSWLPEIDKNFFENLHTCVWRIEMKIIFLRPFIHRLNVRFTLNEISEISGIYWNQTRRFICGGKTQDPSEMSRLQGGKVGLPGTPREGRLWGETFLCLWGGGNRPPPFIHSVLVEKCKKIKNLIQSEYHIQSRDLEKTTRYGRLEGLGGS